jgi:hypothetical protein
MTRTEERLADALGATALALREDTLRPLQVPERGRHRLAWVVPVAAAASVFLVVGLGVALAGYLPGSGRVNGSPGPLTAPPRYYVQAGLSGDLPRVRSTATGAVTDTVKVPYARDPLAPNLVAAAGLGVFFAAVPGRRGEQIYRFRLTAAGRVQELAVVPGGVLDSGQWAADAMAASPDGSQVAVALTPTNGSGSSSCSSSGSCSSTTSAQNDHIDVVNTATGARSVWQGGTGQSYAFTVLNLAWTGNGNELAYFGQWCPQGNANTSTACLRGTGTGGAKAEVWALNPASGGGALNSGRLLFRLSAEFPYLPQALISPDGSMITAVALTGSAAGSGAPSELAVEQISVATGKRLSVLYRRDLGRTSAASNSPEYLYPLTLSADGTGRYWMLGATFCSTTRCSGGFNGWIDGGQLMPLLPDNGTAASEAW